MTDNPEDTGQISVAELLARNGQKAELNNGGRRRRGVKGGISVAELTGEIPVVRDQSSPSRSTAAPTGQDDPEPAQTPAATSRPTPARSNSRQGGSAQFQPVPRRERPQPEPELLSGSTTVAGDLLNKAHDEQRGYRPAAPSTARPPYGTPAPEQGAPRRPAGFQRPGASNSAPAQPEAPTDVTPKPVLIGPQDLAKTAAAPRIQGDFSAASRTQGDSSAASKSSRPTAATIAAATQASPVIEAPETQTPTSGSDGRDDPATESSGIKSSGTKAAAIKAAVTKASSTKASSIKASSAASATQTAAATETAADAESAVSRPADEDAADSRKEKKPARSKGGAVKQWFVLIGQAIVAIVVGALLFKGFEQLWDVLPWVALVLSVLVIVGLVAVVRILRRTDDLVSIVIAIAVGVFVTLGPLAFQLSTG